MEVTYSHTSYEHDLVGFGSRSSGSAPYLHSQEGHSFRIPLILEEQIQQLPPGAKCHIVYSVNQLAGIWKIEALQAEDTVLRDISTAIASWDEQRQGVASLWLGAIVLNGALALLSDRLWCKKEHAAIRKCKEDIRRWEARHNEEKKEA